MSYRERLSFLIVIDSVIVLTAIFVSAFLLRPSLHIFTSPIIISAVTVLVSHHLFSYFYKLYKKAWEYASIGELMIIFKVVTLSILAAALVQLIIINNVHIRMLAITWMLHMLLIGGSRFSWRLVRDTYIKKEESRKRTLIVGAGSAGTMVVRQLLHSTDTELIPVAFIDDDHKKHHLDIMGIPVLGGIQDIAQVVRNMEIEHIVIAIPSLSKKELNDIFQECSKTKAKTQILPLLEDMVAGHISVSQFRDVQVEDLLGREPVELDMDSISDSITNQVVLVTGAGGSIGSEICRQVSKFKPATLILLDHNENGIYHIELELKETYSNGQAFITEVADIRDLDKMLEIMDKHRPDVIYHAAAHKHVPLMERNPEEAVKNNVEGTQNVAKAADRYHVGTFVMISTDKAVKPTSVMGATKRIAEMIVQHMNSVSQTEFVAVRFGNVLGSEGSVIPLFKRQIKNGGPVTVTDPNMVRYFMTIPEASRLVMQAGTLARGGEIFVLDMGEPVKIVDLARNLIKLSGYNVDEIGISYTGIRPGEKLYEELLGKDEVSDRQVFPNVYIGKSIGMDIRLIERFLDEYDTRGTASLGTALLDMTNNNVPEQRIFEDRSSSQRALVAEKA